MNNRSGYRKNGGVESKKLQSDIELEGLEIRFFIPFDFSPSF